MESKKKKIWCPWPFEKQTDQWSWRGGSLQQDMALVDTEDDGNKVLPLSGYAITCVLCLFSFKSAGEDFSMALMWWYTLCDDLGIGTRLPVCGLSSLSIRMVSCT